MNPCMRVVGIFVVTLGTFLDMIRKLLTAKLLQSEGSKMTLPYKMDQIKSTNLHG